MLHYITSSRSSVVNGCHQNEIPNSWFKKQESTSNRHDASLSVIVLWRGSKQAILWIMDYSFKWKCVNDGFIYYKHAAFHCKTLINGLEPYWLLMFLSAVFTLILTAPIHFQQIFIFGWSVPLKMYIHWLILPNILSVVNFTLYLQLVPVAHWEQGLDPRLPWWVYSSMKLPLLCKPAGGSRWHYGGPLS